MPGMCLGILQPVLVYEWFILGVYIAKGKNIATCTGKIYLAYSVTTNDWLYTSNV
jgi:hypothetical protein